MNYNNNNNQYPYMNNNYNNYPPNSYPPFPNNSPYQPSYPNNYRNNQTPSNYYPNQPQSHHPFQYNNRNPHYNNNSNNYQKQNFNRNNQKNNNFNNSSNNFSRNPHLNVENYKPSMLKSEVPVISKEEIKLWVERRKKNYPCKRIIEKNEEDTSPKLSQLETKLRKKLKIINSQFDRKSRIKEKYWNDLKYFMYENNVKSIKEYDKTTKGKRKREDDGKFGKEFEDFKEKIDEIEKNQDFINNDKGRNFQRNRKNHEKYDKNIDRNEKFRKNDENFENINKKEENSEKTENLENLENNENLEKTDENFEKNNENFQKNQSEKTEKFNEINENHENGLFHHIKSHKNSRKSQKNEKYIAKLQEKFQNDKKIGDLEPIPSESEDCERIDEIVNRIKSRQIEEDIELKAYLDYKTNSAQHRYQLNSLTTNLVLDEIYKERSIIMQCFRYIIEEDFFMKET